MNSLVRGLAILLTVVPALASFQAVADQASSETVTGTQTLLLVGFRPFVGREANVGEDIVNLLDGKAIAAGETQLTIRTVVMPVEWGLPEPPIGRAVQAIQHDGQTLVGILILGERDKARVKVDKEAKNQRGMDVIDFGRDGSRTPWQRHLGEKIAVGDPLGAYYAATLFQTIRDGLAHAGLDFAVG
jgi:pyrrolidone-carboxylate peptidase